MEGPDLYVLLHGLPLSICNGAVGLVKGRLLPTADTPDLLLVELVFPRAAQMAHSRLKVPLTNAKVYPALDAPLPDGCSAADVLSLAERNAAALFDAVRRDLLPADAVAGCFGIVRQGREAEDALGQLVFRAWSALVKAGSLSETDVAQAQRDGLLPHLFETRVRALAADSGSPWSGGLAPLLEAREGRGLFTDVDYDFSLLTPLARLAHTPHAPV